MHIFCCLDDCGEAQHFLQGCSKHRFTGGEFSNEVLRAAILASSG